jgi:hypothetical protein
MSKKLPEGKRPEPRIVGKASEEIKERARKIILDKFEFHYESLPPDIKDIIEKYEISKMPYEIEAIKIANDITNKLLEKFGLTPFDIPDKNIHILPEEVFEELPRSELLLGVTFFENQWILINNEKMKDVFSRVQVIFHELIHLKAHFAMEVNEITPQEATELPKEVIEKLRPSLSSIYRVGLMIYSLTKKTKEIGRFVIFWGLNEAVVEEIVKKNFWEFIKRNSYLKEEYEWQNSKEAQKIKKELAEKRNIPIEEIMWVSKDGKDYERFAYYNQRKILYYIVKILYQDNIDKFKSQEGVMDLFFKAHFDGKILEIARLIEKSFGEGSFERIGAMGVDENSANYLMNYLLKKRK